MNKKGILSGSVALIVAAVAAWNFNISFKTDGRISDIALANVEALAQESDNKYENKEDTSVEIWDDESEVYVKIIVTKCTGKGELDC